MLAQTHIHNICDCLSKDFSHGINSLTLGQFILGVEWEGSGVGMGGGKSLNKEEIRHK